MYLSTLPNSFCLHSAYSVIFWFWHFSLFACVHRYWLWSWEKSHHALQNIYMWTKGFWSSSEIKAAIPDCWLYIPIFPLRLLWQLLDWAIKFCDYIEKHIKKHFHVEMQGHSNKEFRVPTFILVYLLLSS